MIFVIFLSIISLFLVLNSSKYPFFSSLQIFNIFFFASVNLSACIEIFADPRISESRDYLFSLILLTIGSLCVNFSYHISHPSIASRFLFPVSKIDSSLHSIYLNPRFVFPLLSATVLFAVYQFFGISEKFSSSFTRVSQDLSLVDRFRDISLVFAVTFLYFTCVIPKFRGISSFFLTVVSFASLCLSSFLSGGRSILLFAVLGVLSVFPWFRKFFSRPLKAFLFFAVILLAFSFVSGFIIYLRYAQQGATASFALTIDNLLLNSLTGLTILEPFRLAVDFRANDIDLLSEINSGLGREFDFLSLSISGFVPRSLWPDKPIQMMREVRYQLYGDTSGGIPLGFFGEVYYLFGLAGILLGSLFVGCAYARFDRWVSCSPFLILSRVRWSFLTPLVTYALMRGGIDGFLSRSFVPFVSYVFIELLFCRHMTLLPARLLPRKP